MEPRGQELISRYRRNYHIPTSAEITEDMILRHWQLERRLAIELLKSTPENRWQVFERCYSMLYSELEWLNQFLDVDTKQPPTQLHKEWMDLIGKPPKKVYEIGSGKGELISHLASHGFECKGTEITLERGQKYACARRNLSWGISDGVHLERFEEPDSYDAVISDQLIEHLHPDDLTHHFKGVWYILRDGGKYVFRTPHAYVGPSDISRVLNCDKPIGMHLKEYTFGEVKGLLKQAEKLISRFPRRIRRRVTWLFVAILFCPSIFVVAQK